MAETRDKTPRLRPSAVGKRGRRGKRGKLQGHAENANEYYHNITSIELL
jgi:hypothetical protein